MTKIATFNKENLKNLRADFASAVKDLEAQYGITIGLGHISFNDNSFTSKLTVMVNNGTVPSDVNPKWVVHFNRNAKFGFGLEQSDLGREFMNGREKLKLVGSRGAHLPLVAQVVGTNKFKAVSVELFKAGCK